MNSLFCPFSHQGLCTALWAAIPLLEMRVSIPIALLDFKMGILSATLWSLLGSVSVTALVLLVLPVFFKVIESILPPLHSWVLRKIIHKTRQKHSHKMTLWGEIFLVIFVAVPIPGSGVVSGALIGWIFGIKFWKTLFLVSLGALFSNIIMVIVTLSGKGLWDLFIEFFSALSR